jgi:hypothetical protein
MIEFANKIMRTPTDSQEDLCSTQALISTVGH